ncbi:serine hydrolase domain-containing protein [Aequorivita sp. Q41]|uniref:serine hydrolase domain-containing protein n=1 Tax=Aequorivita sp. Q41 TaxID=3153300 RepID=UPI003242B80C
MKQIKFLIIALFLFVFPKFVLSQNTEFEIDKLYKVNSNKAGFSVAVFKGDDIFFEKTYGSANLDYNIPITSETVFDIGSIAKQFTAAAILLLEEEGKLSIKDPAYQYIDNLPRYKKGNPTIEQLLNQTSGIKEVDPYLGVIDLWFYDYLNHSQMINIITKVKSLRFTPGAHFYYTNANYILLASIIEKASGESYNDYLQKNIFEPLKMEHTIFNNDLYKVIKNRAIGYTEAEGKFYNTHFYSLNYSGDGQILTNPKDMFKWHQNLKNAVIGTSELWKKMHTKAKLNDGTEINFGLGVEFETHNGYEAVGFDGMSVGGFVSKYLYFPKLDTAFFTTQNTFNWDFRDHFFQFVDLFLPKVESKNKASKYKEIELSNNELKKYEGTYLFYFNDEDSKANTIKLKGNTLAVLTLDGDEIATLIPLGNNRFLFGEGENAIITFSFNQKEKQYTYDELENTTPWLFKEFQLYKHTEEELKEFEGHYFNKDFQIGKKLQLEKGKLYYYYRNGASKNVMASISKDLLEISISPIKFLRNSKNEITGFDLMGVVFEKI